MEGNNLTLTVAELQQAGKLLVEDGNHGEYRPRSDEFSSEGVRFIRAADMSNGRVLFESAQRINQTALNRIRKGIGAGGDVLLSHKGTVGKIAFVPIDSPAFVCSPQTTFWRVTDSSFLDRRYIYYYLLSREFREQLDSRKGETDMADYVSLTTQRTFKVVVPPLPQQKAIAHILGTLDDKIELNRRMNSTLEAMARALFQSWFVDFDPVRAKLDGRTPANLDPATAALFPSSLELSDGELIPNGWRLSRLRECLGDVGYIRGPFGSSLRRSELQVSGIPVYEQQHAIYNTRIFRYFVDNKKYDELKRFATRPNDLIISCSGTVGHVSIIRPDDPNGIISQALLILRPDLSVATPEFLFRFLTSPRGFQSITSVSSGSVQVNIAKRSVIESIRFVLPPFRLMIAFDQIASTIRSKTLQLLREIESLTALRDAMLPKLLSGDFKL